MTQTWITRGGYVTSDYPGELLGIGLGYVFPFSDATGNAIHGALDLVVS